MAKMLNRPDIILVKDATENKSDMTELLGLYVSKVFHLPDC